MIHLVTFSDANMEESSWRCAQSSKQHGAETHSRFNPGNIGLWQEVLEHPKIFTQPDDPRRAWGWWAWKPLIIKRELDWLPDNSTLIYSDAGVEFIAPVSHVIDRMDQDIFLFGNNWEHAHWCKRDVLDALIPQSAQCPACHKWCGGTANRMPCEAGYYYHPTIGKQVQASVIFFRVSGYSRKFVKEWLHWCLFEGGRLIDDSPSRLPNHPEFQEHRHDQAILTTMAYREGIRLHWWPAMYNDGAFTYAKLPCYASDDYPVLFHHHRRRNHEWNVTTPTH